MCGLTGFWNPSGLPSADACAIAQRMAQTLSHRGPDDSGVWANAGAGIALAHRRLSILDLSSAGHQPMVSASGRFIIVFNGEIYNHMEIRGELDNRVRRPAWRGHSDTETLLAGIETWGFADTLKRAAGMFAIALWDEKERTLRIARDRFGEKPMYYGRQGSTFLFGSELKALKAHPEFQGEIDREALRLLLRYNYIPAPWSIYRGIHKLIPGTVLTLREGSIEPQTEAYWSLGDTIAAGAANPYTGSASEAIDELDKVLRAAVAGQMLSDVPLGAFLSGGVDSSTTVALMQAQSARPVKTFSIGFREKQYDEAGYARAVAQHLGTDHTELCVEPEHLLAVIPRLPALYDEPFADSSQIPTFLVSQLARAHVTVALSGDAGDELFGGYPRYFQTESRWASVSRVPSIVRRGLSHGIRAVPEGAWTRLARPVAPLLRQDARHVGGKAHKLATLLNHRDGREFYKHVIQLWHEPERVVAGAGGAALGRHLPEVEAAQTLFESMMAIDQLTYLPDDILVKVDRAAMGVSLETRIPLLDHRVAAFAWRLPLNLRVRNGEGKWILRQALYRYVPERLIDRPKMGFGVPLEKWLRGPLTEWAGDLLDESRLKRDGYFDPNLIRTRWQEHLSGARDWHYHLWGVLMFQAWLRG